MPYLVEFGSMSRFLHSTHSRGSSKVSVIDLFSLFQRAGSWFSYYTCSRSSNTIQLAIFCKSNLIGENGRTTFGVHPGLSLGLDPLS
jgi:hypothetical protein